MCVSRHFCNWYILLLVECVVYITSLLSAPKLIQVACMCHVPYIAFHPLPSSRVPTPKNLISIPVEDLSKIKGSHLPLFPL